MRIEEEIRRAWEELKKKKLAEKKEKERKEEQSEEEKEKKGERGEEGEKEEGGREKEEKEGEKKEEKKREEEGGEEEEEAEEKVGRMAERTEKFEGSGERELALPLLPVSKPQAKPLEAIAAKEGEEKEGKEGEKVFYKPKQAQMLYEMPKPRYEHERLAPAFERPKLERKPEAVPIKFSDGMVEQARMAKQEKLEKMAEESMVEVKTPKQPLEIPKVETYYYKYRPIKKLFEEKEAVVKKYYEEEEEQT
jgi:hypothetical protein